MEFDHSGDNDQQNLSNSSTVAAPYNAYPSSQQQDDGGDQPLQPDQQQQQQQEEVFENEPMTAEFHRLRYYLGHVMHSGAEFLEFELRADGTLLYTNQSRYRKDRALKKQCRVSPAVVDEFKRLIIKSEILTCDDSKWPEPDRDGRQELEVHVGNTHISLLTGKLGRQKQVDESQDPRGLGALLVVTQELKDLVFSLLSLHFRINPV